VGKIKYITRTCIECKENEIDTAIETLAIKYASYKGDPIDDCRVYTHRSGDKCIIIMTPVGEKLIFEANKAEEKTYFVKLIASSWKKL